MMAERAYPFRARWRRPPVPERLLLAGAILIALLPLPSGGTDKALPAMRLPSCAALVLWGESINPLDTFHVAPRLQMPTAFQEPAFSATFGRPALVWSAENIRTARQAIDLCYRQARKVGDRAAGGALGEAASALTRLLPDVIAGLQKSESTAEAAATTIAALPDSPALASGIAILLRADPASPAVNGLRKLPEAVAIPLFHIAETLPTLADRSREAIFKDLDEQRNGIESRITDSAAKMIAAAPDSAAGILALSQQRQDLAHLADPAARVQLAEAIDQRVAQIRDGLRRARPAIWVPPDCTALYRWAAEPGSTEAHQIGRNPVPAMLTDAHVVPVFGIALALWTEADLGLFRRLRASCRAEVGTLRKDQARGAALTAGQSALLEVAAEARSVTDPGRDAEIATARTTLALYRQAVTDLERAEVEIGALPDTTASLAPLEAIRTLPALENVGEQDRNHFAAVFDAKLHAIGAEAAAAAIKGLADVKLAHLPDLARLPEYAGRVEPAIPVASGRQEFITAYDRSMHDAAMRLRPEFQARLDAIPATPEGIAEARDALARLTGIPGLVGMPALEPLQVAAENRVDAIIATMRGQACGQLLSSLGVGSAAKELLWDGRHGVALDGWLCGLAEHGVMIGAWSGADLPSGTSSIQITMPHGAPQTYALHEAEVQPGKEMLVGFSVRDANQETKLSIEQWTAFAGAGSAPVDSADCEQRFAGSEPGKIAPADKPYWLQCGLEIAGLGNRGLKSSGGTAENITR